MNCSDTQTAEKEKEDRHRRQLLCESGVKLKWTGSCAQSIRNQTPANCCPRRFVFR